MAGLLAVWAGCVAIESDSGGTRPPPGIIADGSSGSSNSNSDNDVNQAGSPMIFDVTIVASSSTVAGITIDATLTVVPNGNTTQNQPAFDQVTLRDTINDFMNPSDTTGIVGGIFLTAGRSTSNFQTTFFDLSVADDGMVTAVFDASGVLGQNPNRFILQREGNVFESGQTGITFEVENNSRFAFRIDGDRVDGQLDLIGVPINDIGAVDIYSGTFSGRRRR